MRWLRRNSVHAERSDWLNSYGTFQPMGPNLRRSCTTECTKHMTKSSCRHSWRCTASRRSWLAHAYEARRPARMPTGASLVILMPICSRPMGNCGCGSAVIQRRKSSLISSALTRKVSTSLRYPRPRWVFWRSTHCPSVVATAMYLRAMISCPWPMDTDMIFIFLRLARSSINLVGSAPGDSRQMSGHRQLDSIHVASMLSGTLSTNCCPSDEAM
mmetsp:Transcript_29465/g.94344  ORF Transcript_29465/g.94344 Transcript_29465/m.94344 type:complete len:215 (+) Transcript_29465:2037-2681(+)